MKDKTLYDKDSIQSLSLGFKYYQGEIDNGLPYE